MTGMQINCGIWQEYLASEYLARMAINGLLRDFTKDEKGKMCDEL